MPTPIRDGSEDEARGARTLRVGVPHSWNEAPPETGVSEVCGLCGTKRLPSTEHQECVGRQVDAQPSPHDYEPFA